MDTDATKDYIGETLHKETQSVTKKMLALTGRNLEAIDDLFINHVAVPGLINVSLEIDGTTKTYSYAGEKAEIMPSLDRQVT